MAIHDGLQEAEFDDASIGGNTMTRMATVWRIFLLFLCVLTAAACQRSNEAPKEVIKDVSLFHYWSFSGTFVGTLDAIAADINRQNPV